MDTSHRPHILLVDDDISAIQVLWCLLSDEARIRFAKSAAQALVLAREQVPDLILLDFELPDGNGVELCRTLRQDPQLADVPVIIVTAHARDELQVSALEIGAADFISKPLQAAQLLARVRAQLRLRGRSNAAVPPALPPPGQAPSQALGRVPGQELAPLAAAQAPAQALRVLIVDDDVVAIKMLRNALEAMPVQFHFATRGEEALRLAAEVRPHIILLDAQLPGLDGFEVCRRLKADPQLADTPVIFVTRADDPLTEALALEAGAVDFIGKPYRPAVLKARVQHALQPRRPAAGDSAAAADGAAAQPGVWQRWAAQRVQAVLDSQSAALLIFDAADHVEALNAAARALLGVEASDVQGLGPAALWQRLDRAGAAAGRSQVGPIGADPAALPALPVQDEAWQLTRHDGHRLELRATLTGGGALTQAGLRTLRLQPAPAPGSAQAAPALEGQAPTRLMTLARLVEAAQAGAAELRRRAEAAPLDAGPIPGPTGELARMAGRQERLLLHLGDLVGLLSAQPSAQWLAVNLPDCLRRAGWSEALIAALPADLPALAGDPERLSACLRRLRASAEGLDNEASDARAPLAGHPGRMALHADIGPDRVTLHLRAAGWTWTSAELRRLRWPLPEPAAAPPAGGSAIGLAVTHHLLTELGAEVELSDADASGAGPLFSFSLPRWDAQGPQAPLPVPT
jgi:DNA-binding response OmpR family regulator